MLSLIDHVAITVADVEATAAFYDRLFGVEVLNDYAVDGRSMVRSLRVGGGIRMNVHQLGNGIDLVAARPTPGSADLCFRFDGAIAEAEALLRDHDIMIVDGPSPRVNGAGEPSLSVYFRDLDGSLIELMATAG